MDTNDVDESGCRSVCRATPPNVVVNAPTYHLDISRRNITQCCLHRSVSEPLVRQAIQIFLSDTVMPAMGVQEFSGHFSSMASLVEASSRDEVLPSALQAAALASLGSRFGDNNLRTEAMRHYVLAVIRLRNTDLNAVMNVMSLVASILLMGMYEVGLEE